MADDTRQDERQQEGASPSFTRRYWREVVETVVDGGWGSFFACAMVSFLVLLLLRATVHRHTADFLTSSSLPKRTMGWFNAWRTEGFFSHAGLLIYPEEGMQIYKTHSGSYMWLPYAVYRVSRKVAGHDNYRAMAVFFQVLVAVSSSVVSLLGMRLGRRVGALPIHALILGLCAGVVYQTFPTNLLNYFSFNPLVPVVTYGACFWLLVEDGALALQAGSRWKTRLVAVTVFLFTLSYSAATAIFFFAASGLVIALLVPSMASARKFAWYVAAPLIGAALFHRAQLGWLAFWFPDMKTTGNLSYNDFLWRSGMDGSKQFYSSVWDVFSRRWTSMGYTINYGGNVASLQKDTGEMMTWKWLFVSSAVSVVANAVFALRSPKAMRPLIFVASGVGCYLLCLFVFTQGVLIHPDDWDVLIVFPLVLSLFAILPANALATGKVSSLPVLVTIFGALGCCSVQLRSFAVTYPFSAPH